MPLLGMTVSLPVAGIVSDRWGRRFALSITAFNMAWINAARYWADSYTVFIFIGFLGSAFGSGCMSCCYTLALELVSPTRRMTAVSILASCTCLGALVKGLIAWTQPYWRHLILMLYLPMSISITYFWVAPESVRWLMSKKRYEEAKTILLKASKMNGRLLSDGTLKKMTERANSAKSKENNESAHGIELALYLLSKFCAAATSNTMVVYKAELFPTIYRSRITGFTSTFARIGGFTALLIPAMADRIWHYLPNVLFCVLAFVSAVLLLFTPETLGASLPENMEDAARLGEDQSSVVMGFIRRIIYRKHYDVRHDIGHPDVGEKA
ncbi:solute carrier family 22 member 3-like [Leguminivora glycinivorella]|uniref:solute carrier family 22 member 3-like n=1 Tax=Leguminivora glycinivorella TaxID=1035111 RepID=UPI00200CF6B9|nr:solute carrier family 22 member 3-like [Leguminivora glycinivorella]